MVNDPDYETRAKNDKPVRLKLDNINRAKVVGVFYCHFGFLGHVLDAPWLFPVTIVHFRGHCGHCAHLIEARMLILQPK